MSFNKHLTENNVEFAIYSEIFILDKHEIDTLYPLDRTI